MGAEVGGGGITHQVTQDQYERPGPKAPPKLQLLEETAGSLPPAFTLSHSTASDPLGVAQLLN